VSGRPAFIILSVLSLAACQKNAPEQADQTSIVAAEPAESIETVLAGDLEAKGLVFLGGEISGLTAPGYGEDGSIAEGTPLVETVYYGLKPKAGATGAKQYACEVPEQFQDSGIANNPDTADRASWKCRKLNG
jgi:hypothetical protein